MNIVRIALDLPLPRLFDYLAPDSDQSDIGRRAKVPFGKGFKIGLVVALAATSDHPLEQLKPVVEILRDMPALPADWLALCEFCARYYQAPLGEVTHLALPPMLRRGKLPRMPKPPSAAVAPAPTPAAAITATASFLHVFMVSPRVGTVGSGSLRRPGRDTSTRSARHISD